MEQAINPLKYYIVKSKFAGQIIKMMGFLVTKSEIEWQKMGGLWVAPQYQGVIGWERA